MDFHSDTLLLSTKLKIPAPRKNQVVRKALFKELSQCANMGVIFVRGGAGTGKSTLLSSFIRETGLKNVCWVSLNASNANVYSFWLYFTAAVSRGRHGVFEGTLHLSESDEELDRLNTYADGWIGGLQLAAAAGVAGKHSDCLLRAGGGIAAEYMNREVFESLTLKEKDLLTKTGFLSYFDTGICSALFDHFTRLDFEEMLDGLARKNLFIICVDEQNGIYRYHNILSDYLSQQFKHLPEEQENGLYRKAVAAFEQRGEYEEALRQFCAAGDYDDVLRVAHTMGGPTLPRYHTLPAEQIGRLHFGPVAKAMVLVENSAALRELMRYEEAENCIKTEITSCAGINVFADFFAYNQQAQILEGTGRLNDNLSCYAKSKELLNSPSMMSWYGANDHFGISGVYMRRMELEEAAETLEQAGCYWNRSTDILTLQI